MHIHISRFSSAGSRHIFGKGGDNDQVDAKRLNGKQDCSNKFTSTYGTWSLAMAQAAETTVAAPPTTHASAYEYNKLQSQAYPCRPASISCP
jgi:hypothetical protein